MKKYFLICLCLALIVAAILPTVAFAADESSNAEEDIIYFLNPTAITAVGNYLFVADNIEEGKSAIICFDISADTPKRASEFELDEQIVNLAGFDSTLYAITSSKALKLNITDSGLTAANDDIEIPNVSVIDIAQFNGNLILFTSIGLSINKGSSHYANVSGAVACAVSGSYLYCLHDNGLKLERRNNDVPPSLPQNDVFNEHLTWPSNFKALGIFAWDNNEVAVYGQHEIYYSEGTSTSYGFTTVKNVTEFAIKDVTVSGNTVYVLNDNHQIVMYEIGENKTEWTEKEDRLGSDQVQQDVPQASDYTSFTLVRSKGYPTNIVFRTKGDNSIDGIITTATEYIVIGFDGAKKFYYVLVRDEGGYKFGWVKRNDTAESVYEDDKLEVIDTNFSNDGNVEYRTVFTSLHAVWIYDLPCSQLSKHEYTQKADNMTDVTVLQQFEEVTTDNKTIKWLYVSYQDGDEVKTGFVQQEDVGNLTIHVENTTVIAQRKINSTLFSSVRMYMFGDPAKMTDEYLATYRVPTKDENGETVYVEEVVPPLYSGHLVSVISEENGIALVQIVRKSDGAIAYGYVYSNQLIAVNKVTTNVAVGLSLLSVAIVLTVSLIVVFVQRKKKLSVKADASQKEKSKKE